MRSEFNSPFIPLLVTVFNSILEVFVLCIAGYILARKGILDKKTQKQLNRLNVSLFTPALLFSKVAFFLTPAKLKELWIIPIFFVVVTSVSMIVSFGLGWMFRLKRSQRNFAMAASMFMNSNSLPIALMQSLVVTIPALRWDEEDNKDSMVGRALTYLVCYSTLGMVLRWSYGVRLLAQADEDSQILIDVESPADERTPLIRPDQEVAVRQAFASRAGSTSLQIDPPTPGRPAGVSIRNGSEAITDNGNRTLRPQNARKSSKFYNSFPNSPTESLSRLGTPAPAETPGIPVEDTSVDSSDDEDAILVDRRRQFTAPTSSRFESSVRRIKFRARKSLKSFNDFMTVPLWAALASIVVACIQPLQHILDTHMPPIKGALHGAGNCSIPVTLIVLGAYFYTPRSSTGDVGSAIDPQPTRDIRASMMSGTTLSARSSMGSVRDILRISNWKRHSRSSSVSSRNKADRAGETATVAIAVVSRMLITPLLLLPLMAILASYELHDVLDDPVFIVANVLLISSPPALTLAQITQAASGDAFERLISRTIFWAYCIVTPPATVIYVVLGLVMSRI